MQLRELGNALRRLLTFFKSVSVKKPGVNMQVVGEVREQFLSLYQVLIPRYQCWYLNIGYLVSAPQQPYELCIFILQIRKHDNLSDLFKVIQLVSSN